MKYIFITGGVVSGLGKGITAASLGRLLKSRGLKVTAQKLDPYLNVDPGTMNPVQHGEVFVTDDGAETDLDLGHYERFIDESLSQNSNLTSGRVYWKVITDERKGVYGGQTIQIIPHVTNEIKRSIARNADTGADVCLVEIGGTVGDIESQPFLEAIRQFQHEIGHENAVLIHVTLIPYLKASGEMKTKPTQQSVKELAEAVQNLKDPVKVEKTVPSEPEEAEKSELTNPVVPVGQRQPAVVAARPMAVVKETAPQGSQDGLDDEVVAVIMAAVAAYGYPPSAIRSIRPQKRGYKRHRESWAMAARLGGMSR